MKTHTHTHKLTMKRRATHKKVSTGKRVMVVRPGEGARRDRDTRGGKGQKLSTQLK